MNMPPADLLCVRGLTVRFGGLAALNTLDLTVRESEIFALVGPNGAGKTTLLNCVSGFVREKRGVNDERASVEWHPVEDR